MPGSSTIHVLVANGTTITGLAAGTSTYLRSRGFTTLTPTNSTTKVAATQVYAVSGPPGSATTVASALGLPSSAVRPATAVAPVASAAGATLVVVAGPDLARLAPSGSTTDGRHARLTGAPAPVAKDAAPGGGTPARRRAPVTSWARWPPCWRTRAPAPC